MGKFKNIKLTALLASLALPFVLAQPAFAADGDVEKINTFGKSIISVLTGIGSILAIIVVVICGLIYITSSGDPERLHKAKLTGFWALAGLALMSAAFVLVHLVSNISIGAFGQ